MRSLIRHRSYIWRTAWADVRDRYAGAGLGFVWNILQPLCLIIIFTIVFTSILKHSAPEIKVHYAVYLCSAMLPWTAFAECISCGTPWNTARPLSTCTRWKSSVCMMCG